MSASTSDILVKKREGVLISYPMAAVKVCANVAVGLSSAGYAGPADGTTYTRLVGISTEQVDNAAGSAGDLNIVVERGASYAWAGTGFTAATDLGKDVYLSDDHTVTTTVGLCYAGRIIEVVSSTEVYVDHAPAYVLGGGLTSPQVVTKILDVNGNELLKLTATTSAVNEFTLANAATGGDPSLTASGETNVSVLLAAKGTGEVKLGQATSAGVRLVASQPILDEHGLELIKFAHADTAVNEITVANAATAGTVSLLATGGDTDIPVQLGGKGTGIVKLGQATCAGVQLMASQPILDAAGLELIKFTATATAVNELTIANAAAGNGPSITASGETNVPVTLAAKGTGQVILGQATSLGVKLAATQPLLDENGLELVKFVATATAVNEITITNAATNNPPIIDATGETNVGLTVRAKGTGTLQLGQATGKVAIGTATGDFIGLYGATPVVQANHIADSAGTAGTGTDHVTLATLEATLTSIHGAIAALSLAVSNIGITKAS